MHCGKRARGQLESMPKPQCGSKSVFLAMGHELDSDVTPLEADLEFAVAWKSDFVGRDALLARRDRGATSRMVTILFDDPHAVPLGNEPVLLEDAVIGQTTSAAFGYRVGRPLALAYVDQAHAVDGQSLAVNIAGIPFTGQVRTKAVFDPEGKRMRLRG